VTFSPIREDTKPTAEKPAVRAVADAPPRYKVFVSSAYVDNIERRKVVQDAITMAEMVWHGMEIFTAGTRTTVEECLRCAREADVLVGIIAWRYGWIPENCEKSITEMEYDAAKERLMFVIDPQLPVNPEEDFDPLPERFEKQQKLCEFQQRFSQGDQEHYGFMHLGFQEYLAAREIRRRAFEGDPQVLPELASHFGESWWQEVALLLLALDDPSLFTPYMREVVRQTAFTEYPNLVEMCLDDAAETSPQPFVELLEAAGGSDTELWR
jgi:hypothetical protein